MICCNTDEMLPEIFEVPAYDAVMLCVPMASAEVEKVACAPLAVTLKVPLPIVVVPSRNVTVPVACVAFTVAVNVTASPGIAVLKELVTEVVEIPFKTLCVNATVCA
jgi:hypothetical protein